MALSAVDKCFLKARVRDLVITFDHDTLWILTGRVEVSRAEVVKMRSLSSPRSISLLDELGVKREFTSNFVFLH